MVPSCFVLGLEFADLSANKATDDAAKPATTEFSEATRARHGTDWYLARDQLGEEGHDPDRIVRLAERMGESRAHLP
jgi:hypothetical protein